MGAGAAGKPVLYLARDGEQIPFDIANIERFTYSEIDSKTGEKLTEAMVALAFSCSRNV